MTPWARYPYDDHVVLVTGGGSGISQAIAQAFLGQGATVAAVGRRRGALTDTGQSFSPERVLILDTDLAEPDAPAQVVADVIEGFGK